MSITIEELRKRKEDLEGDIRALLMDFHRATSVHVDRVEPSYITFQSAESREDRLLEGVRVRLDMGLT